MAVTSVVFADVSSLSVGGYGTVESAQSFQASRSVDSRPIYTFNKTKPRAVIAPKGMGQGSFSYVASSSDTARTKWSSTLTGSQTITVVGGIYGSGGGSGTLTFANCGFGGQSESMNVKNELVVTVNFFFGSGSSI